VLKGLFVDNGRLGVLVRLELYPDKDGPDFYFLAIRPPFQGGLFWAIPRAEALFRAPFRALHDGKPLELGRGGDGVWLKPWLFS